LRENPDDRSPALPLPSRNRASRMKAPAGRRSPLIRARKLWLAALAATAVALAVPSPASASPPPRDVLVPAGLGNHVPYSPAGATSSNPLSVGGAKQVAVTPDGTKPSVTTNANSVAIIDTATPSIDASSPITGVTGA